jgi:hypothetical protein
MLRASSEADNQCEGHDEAYAVLTEAMLNHRVKEFVTSTDNASFVYSIFPTLFKWSSDRVAIRAYLRTGPADAHEEYRRRVLVALGAEIITVETPPFQGFLLDPTHHDKAQAIIYLEDPPNQRIVSIRYQSRNDRAAIGALLAMLPKTGSPPNAKATPTLQRIDAQIVIQKLNEHVLQYARATITMETVPLEQVDSLCQLVKGFKFHQVRMLYEAFTKAGISPFECAAVQYADGGSTIATPPVAEESGGRYILVQGTTRALYSHRLGAKSIRCLVVRGASAALPVENRIPLRDVLVAGKFVSTVDRYGSHIDKEYRRIELATHIPAETLL